MVVNASGIQDGKKKSEVIASDKHSAGGRRKGWKRLARQQMVTDRENEFVNAMVGTKRESEQGDRIDKQKCGRLETICTEADASETVVDPVSSVHHEQC